MSENYSLKELNEWADKVIDCVSKWADEMNKAFNGTPTSIKIEKLDFSEHDKAFEDKIASLEKRNKDLESCFTQIEQDSTDMIMELKQRIADLESKGTSDLPFGSLECANYLINATYERETNVFERSFAKLPDKVNDARYTVDELEQIAEHLLVYCKHNKESE